MAGDRARADAPSGDDRHAAELRSARRPPQQEADPEEAFERFGVVIITRTPPGFLEMPYDL